MTRGTRLVAIATFFSLSIGPCVLAAQDGQTVDGDRARPHSRYQLRSGDVLAVDFPFVPDFNQTITVQPDGFVTLRAIGTVRVQSLTVPELTAKLRDEYGAILQNPVLTVDLKEFERPYFVVTGEVERPGKYELRGRTTATQALAVAGGFKDRAKYSEAVIFRPLPEGGFESTPINLKTLVKEGRLSADVPLQPGDMLFVPRGRGAINWSAVSVVVSSLWVVTYLVR
ncbi:MAG TPA: polysaccharide biosynthesis/export family protein [Vicinamibacterales bacterium]|jgi:polysaccharide export outer membrane protein